MKFFKVTDGEDIAGYWLDQEKAQKNADELNEFVTNHNNNPEVIEKHNCIKSNKYYVDPIETED